MKAIKNLRDFDDLFEIRIETESSRHHCIAVDHYESGGGYGSPETEGEAQAARESEGRGGGGRGSGTYGSLAELQAEKSRLEREVAYLEQDDRQRAQAKLDTVNAQIAQISAEYTWEEESLPDETILDDPSAPSLPGLEAQAVFDEQERTKAFFAQLAKTVGSLTIGPGAVDVISKAVNYLAEKYGITDEQRKNDIKDRLQSAGTAEEAEAIVHDYSAMATDVGGGGADAATTGGAAGMAGAAGTAPATPSTDPTQLKFWQEFGTEWQNAKNMYQEQDAWKKAQVPGAMQTYRDRLQGLSGEQLHQPITWGMGDFSTTFMPKSSRSLAQSMLGSELGEIDVMMPYQGEMNYLNNLQNVAMQEAALAGEQSIANIQNPPPPGSNWLETLADVVNVGGGISDIWQSYGGGG